MANLTLIQLNKPQQTLRQSWAHGRRQSLVVHASKEAQLKEMQVFKQQVAQQLQTALHAPAPTRGRPVMAASVEVSGTEVAELRLIDQESFYPTLEAAGDKLVVVDFYTAWCGPCKMIYPELCEMAKEYEKAGVEIVKFECNKANKELGMKLAIKVAPTFHLYRRGEKVAEMTGAKVDKLRELIEEHK
ncbi:hypothetical protein N2152v2_006584 [Parachlorella kessleri]